MKTILAIDQSTSGTKALLFDGEGQLLGRWDLPQEQKINSQGWVSHAGSILTNSARYSAAFFILFLAVPGWVFTP